MKEQITRISLLFVVMGLIVAVGFVQGVQAAVRDDLNVVLTGEPLSLDPALAYNNANHFVVKNVFETLVQLNSAGEIEGILAEEWDISEDLLTFTFKLKEGVKFHNGLEVTADDVKFSFENAKKEGYATEVTDCIDEVVVVDKYNIKVLANTANVRLIDGFGTPYMSIVSVDAYEKGGSDFAMNPLGAGTGGYKFVSWEPGVVIKLTRNEDYHGTPAYIKDVNIRFIAESSSATISLETKQADVISPSFLDARHLKNNRNVQVLVKGGNSVYYLIPNLTQEPFNDYNVRMAMAYAVNRSDIVVAAADVDGAFVTNSLAIPGSFGYNDSLPAFDQDLEKAAEYLAQSAYPEGFSVELTVSSGLNSVAAIIKDQLSKIGIDVRIESLDFSAMAQKYMSGEMELGIMNSSTATPDVAMELNDKIVSASWINFGKYSNPHFDELIAESLAIKDPEKRLELLFAAQEILYDEMPVVPMYVLNSVKVANADLKNFDYDSRTDTMDLKSFSW